MKLTKKRLRQIIKEELRRLDEGPDDPREPYKVGNESFKDLAAAKKAADEDAMDGGPGEVVDTDMEEVVYTSKDKRGLKN